MSADHCYEFAALSLVRGDNRQIAEKIVTIIKQTNKQTKPNGSKYQTSEVRWPR
jgi:hypothetical protein